MTTNNAPFRSFLKSALLAAAAVAGLLGLAVPAQAATYYWGTSGTNTWEGANWTTDSTGVPPLTALSGSTDTAYFNGSSITGVTAFTLSGTTSVNGMIFNNGALTTGSNISGKQVSMVIGTDGITIGSTSTLSIGSGATNGAISFILGANQTWANNNSGALWQLSNRNSIAMNGFTLTIDGPGNISQIVSPTLTGITGTGNIIKNGAGTLTLVQQSTFTGTTLLNAGALSMSATGALQNSVLDTTGTGRLILTGTAALTPGFAGLTGSGSLNSTTVTGFGTVTGLTLRVISGVNVNLAGDLGEGATGMTLNKVNVGTQILSGSNSYTGATTVTAGVLQFGKPTSLYGGDTTSWAKLKVNAGATAGFNVGGSGEFGAGDVTNVLTNLLAVSGSGLQVGSSIGFDTTNATDNSFTVADNIGNSVNGAVSITKLGANTLILSGSSTYSGTTNLNAGVLKLGSSTAIPTASVLALNSGTLDLNGINSTTNLVLTTGSSFIDNTASGPAALTVDTTGSTAIINNAQNTGGALSFVKNGTGMLTFSLANSPSNILSFSGGITLNSGTLKGAGNNAQVGAFGTGPLTLNGGSVWLSRNIVTETYGNNVIVAADIGFLIDKVTGITVNQTQSFKDLNIGANTLSITPGVTGTVSGITTTLAFTGTTTLSGNATFLANKNSFGNIGGFKLADVNNGGFTPSFSGSGAASVTGVISGTGGLTLSGPGNLTLTGTNTYTGLTTVSSGTLAIGNGTTDGSIASANITTNGVLFYNLVGSSTTAAVMSGTGTLSKSGAGSLILDPGAGVQGTVGTLKVNAGTITLASGSLNVTGTSLFSNAGTFNVAGGTIGTLGNANNNGGNLVVTSGTFRNQTELLNAFSASGTVTLNGGAMDLGAFRVSNGTNVGVVNLNGGLIRLNRFSSSGDANGVVNFNGATVQTKVVTTVFTAIGPTYNVLGGGAIFNVNNDITIAAGLLNGTATDGGLTKSGTSTLTMTGTSTYNGATAINAGKLVLSGSLAATSGVTVSSTAMLNVDGGIVSTAAIVSSGTLQGQGSIGALTISAGGKLAPGLSVSNLVSGTLAAAGNVTFADGTAKLSIRLGQTSAGLSDMLSVGASTVTLNGATLELSAGASYATPVDGFTFVLIAGTGSTSYSGTFASSTVVVGTDTYNILYGSSADGTTSGNDVVAQYVAVPEPSTWAMLVSGMGMLVFTQRLRRRSR